MFCGGGEESLREDGNGVEGSSEEVEGAAIRERRYRR